MPKMKSKSSAKKRFRLTGSGKVKRNKAGKSHILTKKSTKRKRGLRKGVTIVKTQQKQAKRQLPYL